MFQVVVRSQRADLRREQFKLYALTTLENFNNSSLKIVDVLPAVYFHHFDLLIFSLQIQMLGYDISWAGFNIIEVMSSPKFTHKRIGYLAASQCFHADSEVS